MYIYKLKKERNDITQAQINDTFLVFLRCKHKIMILFLQEEK